MVGSKNSAKKNWQRGRTGGFFRKEVKYSIKKHKKYLNRKARHAPDLPSGCAYKKLAGEAAYKYLS